MCISPYTPSFGGVKTLFNSFFYDFRQFFKGILNKQHSFASDIHHNEKN